MRKNLIIFSFLFLLFACGEQNSTSSSPSAVHSVKVANASELQTAIRGAVPGTEIVMADGVWKDIQIVFSAKGTQAAPIVLRSETKGGVTIEGVSDLKMSGEYLVVDGLYFRNGYTPSRTVIDFKVEHEQPANHCRVTNTVIENFSQLNRFRHDHWIEFWGRYNQVDHCYLAGKSNQGPTIRFYLAGNENSNCHHRVENNHFGPRPRKGGPKGETMQIGDSYTSMVPGYIEVVNNYFERCNGEVEIISNKCNFNNFRNNVFFESEGSLVMRHGNFSRMDGNIFIGNDNSEYIGGIRVINTGHWITNNYFYKIKGKIFRSPLAVMNGVPKSPQNRYNQVTDAVIAYNTWVDCVSPWQFSVGANMHESDVLPASEIRSARPIRSVVANNIIYNHVGDTLPVVEYDKLDGVEFVSNKIDNQGVAFKTLKGLDAASLKMSELWPALLVPTAENENMAAGYYGFEFGTIDKDVLGNARNEQSWIGSTAMALEQGVSPFDMSKYGTSWFKPVAKVTGTLVKVATGELSKAIEAASAGDVLELTDSLYTIDASLLINKQLTIRSANAEKRVVLAVSSAEVSPAFRLAAYASLHLEGVSLKGTGEQYAFESLEKNMSAAYNLFVNNSDVSNFKFLLKGHKAAFADTISFSNSRVSAIETGIVLNEETEDNGDYDAEFVFLKNCEFDRIAGDVINYYRGGYDESTIGGNLYIDRCTFSNCGTNEKTDVLLKSTGIVNVGITNSTFQNNKPKYMALLWGNKNNHHSDNTFQSSGEIRVEADLKLKIVY